jgi:hypothetical protein
MRLFLMLMLLPALALAQGLPPTKSDAKGSSKKPGATAPAPDSGAPPDKTPAAPPDPKSPPPNEKPKADATPAATVKTTVEASAAPVSTDPAPRAFATLDTGVLGQGHYAIETRGDLDQVGMAGIARVRFGLTDRFELSVGQSVDKVSGADASMGETPIALRYALGTLKDPVPMNPVLEVEYQPRHDGPTRAQVRMLFDGEPARGLKLAANLLASRTLEREDALAQGELSATVGVSYPLVIAGRTVRVGGEGRLATLQQDHQSYQFQVAAGPSLQSTFGPVTANLAGLVVVAGDDARVNPTAVVSYPF